MINYYGYYITVSNKQTDSRFDNNLYAISAYVFFNDGKYKILTKQNFQNHITNFRIEELINKNSINGNFEIIEGNMILLNPNISCGNEIKLKIVDSIKKYNSLTNKYLHFVSWSKHDFL